jgi:uncharacterized protein (TIGR04255 family)
VTASVRPLYSKPPILEAVIQVMLAEPLPNDDLNAVSEKFVRHYPGLQIFRTVEFPDMVQGDTVTPKLDKLQYRRATTDQRQMLVLTNSYVTVSQLAPYDGWQALVQRFARDWGIWRAQCGMRKLARIGMRYINRIDVPQDLLPDLIEDGTYLTLKLEVPSGFGATRGYAIAGQFDSLEAKCEVILNAGVDRSPVPNHIAYTLDIDLVRQQDVPQRSDEILALLEVMRREKNRLFEISITDRARKLFHDRV